MTSRVKYSIGLICLGAIIALLPLSANRSFVVKPEKLHSAIVNMNSNFSVDQVARFIISEDSTVQFIDVRPAEEYRISSIPGSANIPYDQFVEAAPPIMLNNRNVKYILYSNGDLYSNYAYTLAQGLNCRNTYVMKGGLNEWYKTIMNSSFTGEKISARENALFEIRNRASELYTDINSLPDSLKTKYMESKRLAAKKLDGGCD